MKIGYFDCIGGASGDMILGALVDAGISLFSLNGKFRKLPITGWSLKEKKIVKNGIAATSVEVQIKKQIELRNLQIIESLLKKSLLPKVEIDDSIKIFRRLAEAEALVHGTTVAKVNFHEIGAVDTIIDVVGAVCGLRLLGIEKIVVSPLPLGRGVVKSFHGVLPLPAPATIELLKNIPTYGVDEDGEMVTPTGAAILSELASSYGAFPSCRITAVGYGAGIKDFRSRPNLLRFVIGESRNGLNTELLSLLETNIDDATPQIYDFVSERLFKNGALDVWLTPIQMKKNRPAVTLSVLCPLIKEKALMDIFFQEGTTLGVRVRRVGRYSLPRKILSITTPYGIVRVKIAKYNGKIVRCVPEYEDCKKIAEEQAVSIQAVIDMAKKTAQEIN